MFLVAVVNAANVDVAIVWIDGVVGVVGVGGVGVVGGVGMVGVNGVGQDGHFGAGHDGVHGVIVGHTKESELCCWVVCGKLKLIKVMKLSEVENNKRHRYQRDND